MVIIKKYNGVNVLRDDILIGGTKSILMPSIVKRGVEYVYASPVYGGFQIALSAYCQSIGSKATIFCAKRKTMHENTLECIRNGASIREVPFGYLSVVEKRAREYAEKEGAEKLIFGANSIENKILISNRMKEVIIKLGGEPKEIWCVIGSGTLVDSILMATKTAKVYGVEVGAEYRRDRIDDRLTVLKYHASYDKPSRISAPFPSMKNYDLKAWEYCLKFKKEKDVFFWNVL